MKLTTEDAEGKMVIRANGSWISLTISFYPSLPSLCGLRGLRGEIRRVHER
jgi:hypothetical protein